MTKKKGKLVYVAGAIDYADNTGHETEAPAHVVDLWPDGVVLFCPRCENKGETNDTTVMMRNWEALTNADLVVAFLSSSVFSIGTPAEVWEKARYEPQRILLVHESNGGELGLFVRWWQSRGVEVLPVSASARVQDEALFEDLRTRIANKLAAL